MRREIICLANSRKKSGRCIAGIDVETGEWIRPINSSGGALSLNQIAYKNGSLPEKLDIISIPLLKHQPSYYQPENFIIGNGNWIKEGSFAFSKLSNLTQSKNLLLFNNRDSVSKDELEEINFNKRYSLILIQPENVTFEKVDRSRFSDPPQIRAKFTYGNYNYNLSITDDSIESQFEECDYGNYRLNNNIYFTISLASPFSENNRHYKLIAAVII
ncbi:dual OB domain-containing protein [Fuchsiella alkaliacetigena]|uniref:dual OB domain-containing protein n=1 Tax=Fuchsiella alkaliacetigena TaxID=957042 RepID=UPI00200AF0FA|nr:hypothetical protein [Fuchsiella alkaliacetigena]MCK8824342.1 hypothetical protein [Fuchsiella alkaliacetigena]